jgi:4a-hydroxytetrahydrobiopterin dehydratase
MRRRFDAPAAGRDQAMAGRQKLDALQIDDELRALPHWRVVNNKLQRTYEFANFIEAWGFMSAAALVVQEMDHHPEWYNVYNRVRIELVTHDAGGITARDIELAKRLEVLAAPRARL